MALCTRTKLKLSLMKKSIITNKPQEIYGPDTHRQKH